MSDSYNTLYMCYRKKEEESKRKLLENPVKMKQLQKAVSCGFNDIFFCNLQDQSLLPHTVYGGVD